MAAGALMQALVLVPGTFADTAHAAEDFLEFKSQAVEFGSAMLENVLDKLSDEHGSDPPAEVGVLSEDVWSSVAEYASKEDTFSSIDGWLDENLGKFMNLTGVAIEERRFSKGIPIFRNSACGKAIAAPPDDDPKVFENSKQHTGFLIDDYGLERGRAWVKDLLAAERLRFLSQLVHSGSDAAWALLQHCPDSANVLLQAGDWLLRAVSATCPYPAFVSHWEAWKALILRRPKLWKGLIRRSLEWHKGRRSAWALIDRLARHHWVALVDPVAEVPDSHACLICKCAFSCAQTWASHAVLKHGYRSPHFRAAVGNRCRACGTIFANVRRHRTHLQVSAACRQSVLRGDPDLLPVWTSTDAHVQSRAIKGRGTSHLPPPARDLAHELLSGLEGLSVASDEDIFALVQKTVEPFPVLVQTLSCWIAGLPPGALRDAAEDVRLCLQVDLLCDDVAGRRTSCDREGLFRPDVRPLAWAPRPAGLPGLVLLGSVSEASFRLDIQPGGGWRSLCFASPPHASLDFAGAFLRFPKPPLRAGSLWDLPSCTLRDMRRYLVWLQRCLSWISLALRLASSGRACILDFGQVPSLSGPVKGKRLLFPMALEEAMFADAMKVDRGTSLIPSLRRHSVSEPPSSSAGTPCAFFFLPVFLGPGPHNSAGRARKRRSPSGMMRPSSTRLHLEAESKGSMCP
ncbi:hypothetical protein AK812_SmicGene2210 [Symbiodinium microadriaticum]|uniref:C2H2-type domain-containing protein n=1 Tax=Symbiodinium microadriaticum TaxID=2951 RepID=A0A1Q9F253_SYMMI|nr:hypothetical protein AK812_SmicGene2210 [Symbiodinium microadriaticum]